ncbi:hypothetical protein DITRI_Ditri17bG0121300 [Diplodiscus trichospermus]
MDEAEASDGFSEWEHVQSPTHQAPSMARPGEQDIVVSTQENNLQEHQQQHELSVFPPSRHEGLEITTDVAEEEEVHAGDELEVNSSVGSRSSSTGDGANSGALKKANEIGKILCNGIVKVGARIRYYMAFGWGVWSVGAVGGVVAAVLLSLAYAKVKSRRPRVKEEKKDRLVLLIQEKDQKINQLLVQIAHMNELFLARRRVAVLRVS